MKIHGIVAMDKNKGIGKNNELPWYLPEDLSRFKRLTKGDCNNAIIMGKNTWNSISFLPDRDHLILSSTLSIDYIKDGNVVKSFPKLQFLLEYIDSKKYDNVWVIGGSSIYKQFLNYKLISELRVTLIDQEYSCDVYFPEIPESYFMVKNQVLSEASNNGNYTTLCIFKNIEPGMKVIYEHNVWTVVDISIHPDNPAKYYYLIKNTTGKEVKSVKSKIKLK
jgi:dihydrofolate reductase